MHQNFSVFMGIFHIFIILVTLTICDTLIIIIIVVYQKSDVGTALKLYITCHY